MIYRGRSLALLSLAATFWVLGAAESHAQSAPFSVETAEPELSETDGEKTVELDVLNLRDSGIEVAAVPRFSQETCTLRPADVDADPGQPTKVKLTLSDGCLIKRGVFSFNLVEKGAEEGFSIRVDASEAQEDEGDPNWDALWVFGIAGAALLLAAGVLLLTWFVSDKQSHSFRERLKYLPATWSFKESWASNATAAATLLTAIFGSSEVVKSLLGEEAESAVALASVGAVCAAAFVGFGPILLLATKSRGEDGKFYFTAGGLVLASILTLTGAFGELWIVHESAKEFDLGGFEDDLKWFFILATLVLALYAVRTIHENLEVGTHAPVVPPVPPSDALVAAAVISGAVKDEDFTKTGEFKSAIEDLAKRLPKPSEPKPGAEREGTDEEEVAAEVARILQAERQPPARTAAIL